MSMKQIKIAPVAIFLLACLAVHPAFLQALDSPLPHAPWRLAFTVAYDRVLRTADLMVEDAPIKNGIDVQRNYFERPPFADLLIEAGSAVSGRYGFGVAAEAAIRPEWQGNYFRSDNLPLVNGSTSVEGNLFSRSVVYWKEPSIGIAFGRDSVDYNGILEGGLLPSSRLPWYDSLRGYGRLGRFTLDSMIATIPAVRAWDGKDVALESEYGFETDLNATIIVEVLSKITWSFGPAGPGRFSVSAADHAMLARYNNRFYLTDLFPLVSRHQASVPQTNNSMVLTATWQPFAWLELAAQAGFDDINLNPLGVSDTGTPTIDAYVAGARLHIPLSNQKARAGAFLDAYVEAGMTHWLWGNYDGSEAQPNDVNYFLRFIYRYPRYLGGSILLPLTSPYGPGAVWIKSHGTARVASGKTNRMQWDVSAGYHILYLNLNTEANLVNTKVYNNTTTADAARSNTLLASIPLSLTIGPFCGTIEPVYLWHDGQSAFELEMSLSCRITAGSL